MAFDKVIDSAKLDGAITATADAIREKAGITDKLEWNQETGFAEAISAISVDFTRITLLKEQQFSGFVVDPTFGAYSPGYVAPALFKLENGKTYHVVWDGTEYECVAYVYDYSGISIVAIGNGSSLGLPSNGEPFLITYNAPYDNTQMFSTEATDSHTVGIWQEAESGGGDCADIRYVTFMSEDGTVELGKKAVAVGDDCADPIARGVFSTPTKPSTAQYNYTFSGGWATTPGGGKDSNALKAVNENRTVYANFIAAVRYYTVRFYDGETLVHTESVPYGGSSTYEYVKGDHIFNGWKPEPNNITADMNCYGSWIESVAFADASWETIARISESGMASTVFAVGDQKLLTLTDPNGETQTVTIRICGFNKDTLEDGVTKAGITVLVTEPMPQFTMSSDAKEVYSWETCSLRNKLNTVTFPSLPEELRNVIKSVKKNSRIYIDKTTTTGEVITYDKLWIPSLGEKNITTSSGVNYYGETDDRFYAYNSPTTSYWFRTGNPTTNYQVVVWLGSRYGWGNTVAAYGVMLGFCI